MFTSILRIGPFVILESILLSMAFIIYLFEALPRCYAYTLTEMGFIIFLIEMYASLRIMKNSAKLRKKYIKDRIEESKAVFYSRLVWDNINLILILMLLYSALVADGLRLTSNPQSYDKGTNDNKDCEFSLFSICLFSDMVNSCSFSTEDSMIVWMLYAATTFLISLLCIIVSKEYYQYCSSLSQNRRLSRQYELNQTLLDCSIYRISESTTITEEVREGLGECAICLHILLEKQQLNNHVKIIRLKCGHHFHEECIQKWLKVKDHCPYRCFLDQK